MSETCPEHGTPLTDIRSRIGRCHVCDGDWDIDETDELRAQLAAMTEQHRTAVSAMDLKINELITERDALKTDLAAMTAERDAIGSELAQHSGY